MTKDEADRHAHELGEADSGHHYFAREGDGEWEVVRVVALPGRVKPERTAIEARPRPEAPDPRETIIRNIPPYGGG
jgi:hypothetical protein